MHHVKLRSVFLGFMMALSAGCATQPTVNGSDAKAVEGYIEDIDKLSVVDCLLPGQIRKLGSQMNYLSARQPVRTTEADCEVRGGEYVAYDRANYASALQVWLPKARDGDATAQLYVGQIYEKGLGRAVDYAAAAEWYEKAAKQGNAQAQVNLGALYERGLGVKQDDSAASNWYRKASGLADAGLQFAAAPISDPERTELETLRASAADNSQQREELERLRAEVDRNRDEAAKLRGELQAARGRLLDQEDDLRHAQDELSDLRQRLSEAQATAQNDEQVRRLEGELRAKEKALRTQQSKVDRLSAAFAKERRTLSQELQRARQAPVKAAAKSTPAAVAQSGTATPPASTPSPTRTELEATEDALHAKMEDYRKSSAELTQALTQKESSTNPQSRERIAQQKAALQAQSIEIASLREKVELLTKRVNNEQQNQLQLASNDKVRAVNLLDLVDKYRTKGLVADAGPRIEIINPPEMLTRSGRSIQLPVDAKEIVGKVSSSQDVVSLVVNKMAVKPDAAGLFRVPVDSKTIDRTLMISATDKGQRKTAVNIVVVTEIDNAAESSAPAPAVPSTAGERPAGLDFGRYYALIIGNNAYGSYPMLQTAVNDARSLDVVLRERYAFSTKLLLNANRYQIMSALNEIHRKLTANDNLLIYYAGHGEIDQASRAAYWLPVDAEKDNSANWISSQSITELLSIMPARHILVLADSCYAGALAGSGVARLPDKIDPDKREKWLKVMTQRRARTVLTSGGLQPILDQGTAEHSVFAAALLKVLRANRQVLEDYNVFRALADQVRGASTRAGLSQTPQYAPLQHAGHEGSPFIFVPNV